MKATVLLATAARVSLLRETLASISRMKVPKGHPWEVIVVENRPGAGSTSELVNTFRDRLPLRYLEEPLPGKNHALNRALEIVKGDLVVFTDDDVQVPENWLGEYGAAAERLGDHTVFGGPIRPRLPATLPLDFEHPLVRSALVLMDRGGEEIDLEPSAFWGPNFAVRRRVFDAGLRFDPDVGPDGSKRYVMGSETEFLLRLEKAGHRGRYLPRIPVMHLIRSEQLEARWLATRSFRMGRGEAHLAEGTAIAYAARMWTTTQTRRWCLGLFTKDESATILRMEAAYWSGSLAERLRRMVSTATP